MPNVLVLGSGMVSRPLVRHLLAQPSYHVTVGDQQKDKVQSVVTGHPQGRAIALDVTDTNALASEVADADVIVSILPFKLHHHAARLCLELNKHFLTASYTASSVLNLKEFEGLEAQAKKEAMLSEIALLNTEARAKGLVFLTDMGLDPGIDHMSAMQIIDKVHAEEGRVRAFRSYCGGLPAPEANNNPFGYKFSWAPRGVFEAMGNNATFLKGGQVTTIPNEVLFQTLIQDHFDGIGTLEGYPNRDSLEFIDDYGIRQEAHTMIRGTYRYPGWCTFWNTAVKLGLLDQAKKDLGSTISAFTMDRIIANRQLPVSREFMDMAIWLGLMSAQPMPEGINSAFDLIVHLAGSRLVFSQGEQDMSVLNHVFEVEYPEAGARITSTLTDYGIPNGDSSMSRTVGLTAAIGAKLILEGRVQGRGVIRPTTRDIYEPALAELASLGISMVEKRDTWPIRNF